MPAASAALSALTSSTTGGLIGVPTIAKDAAKMPTASTKLAIGPATTMAARRATEAVWKSPGLAGAVLSAGRLAALASPWNFT
jgi:hypothetical protein